MPITIVLILTLLPSALFGEGGDNDTIVELYHVATQFQRPVITIPTLPRIYAIGESTDTGRLLGQYGFRDARGEQRGK